MSATPSRLQLNSYYLKELSYVLKDNLDKLPGKKTDSKTVDLEISDLTTPLDDKESQWRCELTVKSANAEEEHFYEFRIVMVGFFTVDSVLSPQIAQLIAETNSPAVLYSACREIVATVTRRSPYPGTLLPTVTFVKPTTETEPIKKPLRKRKK